MKMCRSLHPTKLKFSLIFRKKQHWLMHKFVMLSLKKMHVLHKNTSNLLTGKRYEKMCRSLHNTEFMLELKNHHIFLSLSAVLSVKWRLFQDFFKITLNNLQNSDCMIRWLIIIMFVSLPQSKAIKKRDWEIHAQMMHSSPNKDCNIQKEKVMQRFVRSFIFLWMIVKQLLSNFNQDFQAAPALEVLWDQQIYLTPHCF